MKLRKRDAPSYRTAVITFPANEPDLQKAMDGIGIGITTEKLCVVDAVQNEDKGLHPAHAGGHDHGTMPCTPEPSRGMEIK